MGSSRTRFGRVSIKVKLSGRGWEIKRERRRACAQQQRQACQRNAEEREARFLPVGSSREWKSKTPERRRERERKREENGIPNRG